MSGVEVFGLVQSFGIFEIFVLGLVQVLVNGVDDSFEFVKLFQILGILGIFLKDIVVFIVLFFWDLLFQFYFRCFFLGDLFGEGFRRLRKFVERLYRVQLEVKVVFEQTEKLLNKVLGSESVFVSVEILFSQVVEQLRQVIQVLQEIRDLGELSQEVFGLQEKRKELVIFYRRSVFQGLLGQGMVFFGGLVYQSLVLSRNVFLFRLQKGYRVCWGLVRICRDFWYFFCFVLVLGVIQGYCFFFWFGFWVWGGSIYLGFVFAWLF